MRKNQPTVEETGDGQAFGPWYNPRTGQQFPRLPTDPLGIQTGVRKGWIPGIAPIELAAMWEAAQAERDAEYERRLAEQRKATPDADLLREETADNVDQVASAVIDKLIALGVIKVPVVTEEEVIEDEVPVEPVQNETL